MMNIKQIMQQYGFLWSYASAFLFFIMFFSAYANPAKEFTFGIDYFAEANLEFIIFLILIPVVIFSLIENGSMVFNKRDYERSNN